MPRGLTPTGPDPTFETRVEDVVRRMVRAELARLVGPANADQNAQQAGGGLGIQNIRRGVMFLTSDTTSDTTVAPGSLDVWTSVLGNLAGTMYLSGRPLLILVSSVLNAGVSTDIKISATLRGVEVTGRHHGMALSEDTTFNSRSGFYVVTAPDSGPADLELVASCVGSNNSIVGTGNTYNPTVLLAVEL